MATLTEVFKNPTRQNQAYGTWNSSDNSVSYTVIEWWIIRYDVSDGILPQPVDAMTAAGLPIPSGIYPLGIGATQFVCKEVRPQVTDSPNVFECQVEYVREPGQLSGTGDSFTIDKHAVTTTQPAYYDKDNVAIKNSANQTFDPQPVQTLYDSEFEINFTINGIFSDATMEACRGFVNSDTVSFNTHGLVRTYSPRQLLFVDGGVVQTTTNGQTKSSVKMVFRSRIDTYITKILNQGYCVLNSSGNPVNAKDDNYDYLNSQIMLDSSGHKLPSGGTPVFLTFKIEKETALQPLVNSIPVT